MRQIIPCGFNLTSKVFEINNHSFIMIPKNASNTILFGSGYQSNSKKFSQIDSHKSSVNVFIRDPISRFEAGIIESIKRSSPFILNNYVASRSSVPTSEDILQIYNNVLEELNKDCKKFILNILKILEQSFYDPHLCPQWYFFTSLNCHTICEIKLFLLDDLDKIMSSFDLQIQQNYNVDSFFDTDTYKKNYLKSRKKIIKKFIKKNFYLINKLFTELYFFINPNSSLCSPSLNPVFNYINYKDWISSKTLIRKTIKENDEIRNAVKELYKLDYFIYETLIKNKEVTLPKFFNMQQIYNHKF